MKIITHHQGDDRLDPEFRREIESVSEPLELARRLETVASRARLVENMRAARQDIAQMFIDVDHWNRCVRKPGEAEIDPDPNGDLKAIAAYYDRVLKNEVQ